MSQIFHPDLRAARFLPRATVGPRSLKLVRLLTNVLARTTLPCGAVVVEVEPGVSVRIFRPAAQEEPTPALLWLHGGGYVIGTARQDDRFCRRIADQLGITVASVDYRLAPEHPYPTPLFDCYAALSWLAGQPDIDHEQIAVGGASAGAGLAAGLALLARERRDIRPVLQLLAYPMLDDRTTRRVDFHPDRLRLWSPSSNRFGWRSYLGRYPDTEVPPLAAPARCEDLCGLPPAWIGVGTLDLFHDEDVLYAERLREAGVPCTLLEVPGAYHGFDLVEAKATVSQEFQRALATALATALSVERSEP